FQCPRPTFDGGVVRLGKLPVGALQVIEQGDIVNGNRGLGGQGFEEVKPFFIAYEPGTMKDLQHPHDLSFRYQRHSMVADEVLARQKYPTQKAVMLLYQIRDVNDAAFLC